MIIDACNKLNENYVKQFKNSLQSNNIIVKKCSIEKEIELTETFIDDFFSGDNIDETSTIEFKQADSILIFNGLDFNYWKKTKLRRKKLSDALGFTINEQSVKQTTTNNKSNIYSCAIAIEDNNEIKNIESFVGSKKDCIKFINEKYSDKKVRTINTSLKVVINLVFDENDTDLSNWLTFEDLVEIGAITI